MVSHSVTADGERPVGSNDDSQRKTQTRRGEENGRKGESGKRKKKREQAVETIREREGRSTEECGACGILIVLAVSTSCLKIRFNERWRDLKERRDI